MALILWSLVLPLLAGCEQGDPTPADAALRLGIANVPRNLDQRLATDAGSERVSRLHYRRLVEFDAGSLPVPSLATWERLTQTHYPFTLGAAGREFADSSRLSAEDVVATYASILDPTTASPRRALLGIIKDLNADGPDRIDFDLREPAPCFQPIGASA